MTVRRSYGCMLLCTWGSIRWNQVHGRHQAHSHRHRTSVITILDRIGYDFRCRVIMGDHASREMTLGFFDGPAVPVTYTDLDEF